MSDYSCPACGGPVRFKSRVSVFSVCSFCSQMLVRRDLDVEAVGKMALLPEDSSPFQIGTEGKYEGRRFTLVGKLRQQWSDGNWNEWFALFDNGTQGWLGEAQGFLSMSFAAQSSAPRTATGSAKPSADNLPPVTTLRAGKQIHIGGVQYQVDDVKSVTCVGSQGELPFRAPQGRQSTSVDLTGPKESFANLDYSSEGTLVYVGRYLDFEDFGFKNLRQMDGW